MAEIDKITPIMPPQEKQYYISSGNSGISENLSLDSRFANRLTRGAMGNENVYVTSAQSARLKQYIPASKWGKDERVVFLIMQDLIDRSGTVPTVGQISQVSKGRQATLSSGESKGLMSMQSVGAEETPVSGLSVDKVQRALNKLQKRGIVFEKS